MIRRKPSFKYSVTTYILVAIMLFLPFMLTFSVNALGTKQITGKSDAVNVDISNFQDMKNVLTKTAPYENISDSINLFVLDDISATSKINVHADFKYIGIVSDSNKTIEVAFYDIVRYGILNFVNLEQKVDLYFENIKFVGKMPAGEISSPVISATGKRENLNAGVFIDGQNYSFENLGFSGKLDSDVSLANEGGAISIGSTDFSVNNAIFKNNSALKGGAIHLYDTRNNPSAVVNITNSKFFDNQSKEVGGAVEVNNSYLTIENCEFIGNQSAFTAGTALGGGAVYSYGSTDDILIKNSLFENNSSYIGGAVAVFQRLSSGNPDDFGNLLTLDNSVFKSNSAERDGGAVISYDHDINITGDSKFISNTATNFGGAVYSFLYLKSGKNTVTVDSENPSTPVLFEGNSASNGAGAIFTYMSNDLNMKNTKFVGNTTSNNGGGIYMYNLADSYEDVISADESVVFENNKAGFFTDKIAYKHKTYYDTNISTKTHSVDESGKPAVFSFNNYDIHYEAQGYSLTYTDPSGTIKNIDSLNGANYYYNNGDSPKIEQVNIDNDKMRFDGWKVQGTDSLAGDKVTFEDKDIVLVAQWILKYRVFYDNNAENVKGLVIDDTVYTNVQNTATVLGADDLDNQGYDFVGWNTSKDGSGVAFKKGDILTLDSDVTLFAQWKTVETQPPTTTTTQPPTTKPETTLPPSTEPETTASQSTVPTLPQVTEPEIILQLNKKLFDDYGNKIGTGKPFVVQLADINHNVIQTVELIANGDGVTIRGLKPETVYIISEKQGTLFDFQGFNISESSLIEKQFLAFKTEKLTDDTAGVVYITLNNKMDEINIDLPDPPKDIIWPQIQPDDIITIQPQEIPLSKPAAPSTGVSSVAAISGIIAVIAFVFAVWALKKQRKTTN